MSFDNSRFTFNHLKDYSGVVMEQGRVQLDSDWNEWLAELTRRNQAGTLDILGRAVYPATTPYAFQITASSSGGKNTLTIGPGRMYVDGLLAENHGDPAAAHWDPTLAEMSNTPQPPPVTETGAIDYTQQPYMPAGTTLPPGNGPFLAYLDLWIRPITYLQDSDLIDKAIGVDSTGRLQTAWQVRLKDLSKDPGASCDSPISGWPPASSAGLLSIGTTPTAPSGPCCLTSGAAYTGMENQFYRVEIHQPGTPEASAVPPTTPPTGATFKWSRDNGSVITGVISISNVTNSAGNPASQLTVLSLGRDKVLGFAPGNWIEILDDSLEFGQTHGELHQIDTIDFAAKTITLGTTLSSFPAGDTDPKVHTRIRRWDQSGKVYEQDGTTVWWDIDAQGQADIPVPPAGIALILENGITVSFDVSSAGGSFLTGDFWTSAARTPDGSVEKLDKTAPRGIQHHYARLSIVTFPNSAPDCRTKWPPSTSEGKCGCCSTCTVGDGVESVGQYTSINDAINALPNAGGEVCILPGRYFENVLIENRRDVVLRGCGWQTRIASESLKPAPAPDAVAAAPDIAGSPAPTPAGTSTFNAVITVSQSQHVKLLSFAVEAAQDEVGILIDGTGKLTAERPVDTRATSNVRAAAIDSRNRVVDVAIDDLVMIGSKAPAILAASVALLQIENNRIAMENVDSSWPTVWVSGSELRIRRNWLGTRSTAVDREWLPGTVTHDLPAHTSGGAPETTGVQSLGPIHPGGIQIAGPSRDVFVIENEIDSAGRNGITLGSVSILDDNGNDTGQVTGVTVDVPGPCDTTITLQVPPSKSDQPGSRIVAAGKLINVQIHRNRIRNIGACGIGPVGFFTLSQTPEVISIHNLAIGSNSISRTLLRELVGLDEVASSAGYGAICVPDVENLVIRDNGITDFGLQPGDPVCGILVLHGEMIDISRNQVLETRDWNSVERKPTSTAPGFRGGIVVLNATPPTFSNVASLYNKAESLAAEFFAPAHVPGAPALRVEHNVVRVASGEALETYGFGPFSIVNNHLASAGTTRGGATAVAQTVLILNLGLAIEAASLAGTFSKLGQPQTVSSSGFVSRTPGGISSGAVTFTNNICQLEARISRPHYFSSVSILSLDDVIFSNNQCWIDAPSLSGVLDAWLVAAFLQVTGNRFQEVASFPVLASGFTIGGLNITAQNISTYCLFVTGTLQPALDANNLSLVTAAACSSVAGNMKLSFKES